jgi:aminopeptidase
MNSQSSSGFSSWVGSDPELGAAAKVAVQESLKIQRDEKVLIVTNPVPDVSAISMALFDAVAAAGGKPTLIYQPVKTQLDFAEEIVIAAFEAQPDVVLSISAEKIGKDRDGIKTPYEWDGVEYDHVFHYQMYGAKTLRSFWSPSVTRDMFVRTVPIDYAELRGRCGRIAAILDKAVSVRVTSAKGTDITVGITGRKTFKDDGNLSSPGAGGNLPAGEAFFSPVVGSAEGVIVFDGSIVSHQRDILIKTPIRATVKGGFITDVSGGEEAKEVLESISLAERNALEFEAAGKLPSGKGETYARNARNIGELGIGLNPKARVSGNMLEDEKAFRTCHFAIGHNYDEDAPALIHLDGLVMEPTIVAIMANGRNVVIEEAGELKV